MIRNFRSKPLKHYFEGGDAAKLPVKQVARVRMILQALDVAETPDEMNIPGLRFHSLRGKAKRYAVDASGNYRITFAFSGKDAVDVDIEDYH